MCCPNRLRGFGKCRRLAAETPFPRQGGIGRLRRPGVPVFTGGNKRGQGHRMVPLPPLDSPKPSFKPRLPSDARLKARGPQGRLVLQGYTLDGSGAFRSGTLPPCTGWPRTVMRGELRKGNSGHNSVPKSARRTEPSPRNPRFAAHLRCVSAKEGKGSQEGTGNHMVSCPLLFPPVNTGPPAAGRRQFSSAVGTAFSPPPDGGSPAARHRLSRRQTLALPPPKAALFGLHLLGNPL